MVSKRSFASIVHPFNNNWNGSKRIRPCFFRSFNRTSFQQQLKLIRLAITCRLPQLQSYILSTTTETAKLRGLFERNCFNRTSFQQQLKPHGLFCFPVPRFASIVHPFNNNWNKWRYSMPAQSHGFNRTSFQQQLKPNSIVSGAPGGGASIVHPFNNNWNRQSARSTKPMPASFNRTSFQQQLKRPH